MSKHIIQAADGSRHIIEVPDGPAQDDPLSAENLKKELDASGGYLENFGAGMNKVVQGGRQLLGHIPGVKSLIGGETDAQIEERRKLDEKLAEGRWGGGAMQLAGELTASAPLTMGAGGAAGKLATKALPRAAEIAGNFGGRIANLGTVGRGAVEGATQSLLGSTTSDESPTAQALLGGAVGGALPLAVAGGSQIRKILSKSPKVAELRAAKIFEDQLGPADIHDIGFRLDTQAPPALPLSTAAQTSNPKLAGLERGARTRSDWQYTHDKPVAEAAWNKVQQATAPADELSQRVAGKETVMKAGKDYLDQFKDPADLKLANTQLGAEIEALRNTPAARQNPKATDILGEVESLLKHPKATAADYATQYWNLTDNATNQTLPTEVRQLIGALKEKVGSAADVASKGEFTPFLERYKAGEAYAGESEAAKAIRESFKSPEGVLVGKGYGDTPEITSKRLQDALRTKGANEFGDVLAPQTRQGLEALHPELTQHEMYQAANSPGTTSLEHGNPLAVVSSGRDNPFNYWPVVKGGANWLAKGARTATTEAADTAMQNPAAWQKMMKAYKDSKSPLSLEEFIKRELLTAPANAAVAGIGD